MNLRQRGTRMRPLRRRTRFEKAVKTVRDAKLPAGLRSAVSDVQPPKAVKSGAIAVAAATAASAAVSALRRRLEEGQSDQ
jgi:hypothetical protein